MQTTFCLPSNNCSVLVKGYLFLSTKKQVNDKFIPDGYTAIVFNFNKSVTCIDDSNSYILPNMIIINPVIKTVHIKVEPATEAMVVLCKTSVFSKVFCVEMNHLPQMPFHIINLFNDIPIWELLKNATNLSDRISIFESYLINTLNICDYIPDMIDLVYFELILHNGNKSIAEIINEHNINPRTFRRKFLKRVGISSKVLVRIVKIRYFWQLINTVDKIDLHNIIFLCNYYDQSHFIKDFKKIMGETPKHFYSRNLMNVKYISGIPNSLSII